MHLAVASLSLPCLVLNFCFRQEGWRLEHKEPKDQSSPIEFKGIVFNEMKGVFVCNYLFKLTIMRKGVLVIHRVLQIISLHRPCKTVCFHQTPTPMSVVDYLSIYWT